MNHDDDLYAGYDDSSGNAGSAMFQVLGADGASAAGASTGPPGTAMKSYVPGTSSGRTGTAMQDSGSGARPMTSNRGAGFSSVPNKRFDPMNRSGGSTLGSSGALLTKKSEITPEEQARDLEKKVHEWLEQTASLCAAGNVAEALDKAMECKRRERSLCKFREANGLGDQNNIDLTFAVDLSLAHMYHMNKNYSEALNLYTVVVKNQALAQSTGGASSARLRVNMGNIFFEQKKYSSAIKNYRMALDKIPATVKEVRFKIMRNIGVAFVKMGQYQDALQAFTTVMENVPDHQTGFDLVICNYALGDREGMKRAFLRLLEVPPYEAEDDDEDEPLGLPGEEDDLRAVVHDDGLKDEIKRRQAYITRVIVQSAQLISEKIEKQGGFVAGYDWCTEQLRSAGYVKLANEVELAKASKFLAARQFEDAVAVFKDFEKKEPRVKARAATNLSFLYVLEGAVDQAEKYADMGLKADRYNARAFVNKGTVLLERGDFEGARTLFQEAAGIEPYCVEAIFNLGMVNQRLNEMTYAVAAFKKLHQMLPDNVEAIYQIANTYDMAGDYKSAIKWFEMLSSLVPNDPGVLARLGAIHARIEDEPKALHYYQESHRVFPVSMDVISWLGAFHVRNEVYEKALVYFDLASKIQPQEVKWALMAASCYRRIGALPQALAKYKEIHAAFQDNVECLRYLVHLCTELGRRADAQEFMSRLQKAEKTAIANATATAAQQAAAAGGDDDGPGGGGGYGGSGIGVGLLGGGGGGGGGAKGRQANGMANGGGGVMVDDIPGPTGGLTPNVGSRAKKMVVRERDAKESDDWGNEQLGDDLLPM